MIRASVTGADPQGVADLLKAVTEAAAGAIAEAAADMASDARERVHELRAPGRPLPSELAGSIAATSTGLTAEVRASAGHAAAVEFGTRNMAARPYFGPAAESLRGSLAMQLAAHLRAGIRGL